MAMGSRGTPTLYVCLLSREQDLTDHATRGPLSSPNAAGLPNHPRTLSCRRACNCLEWHVFGHVAQGIDMGKPVCYP